MRTTGGPYLGYKAKAEMPDRYKSVKEHIDPFTMSSKEMEKVARENQSGWEVAGNTLASFATNAASSFMDSWGTVDLKNVAETMASKKGTTFGNPINMAANQLREWGSNQFPIYNEEDRIVSLEYLASQLASMGTTVGFMGGTMSQLAVGNKVAGALGLAKILPYLRNAANVGVKQRKLLEV